MGNFARNIGTFMICVFSMSANAADIQTATGPESFDAVPEKVAVFDIAAIDTLSALGVPIDGVPDKLFLDRLRDKFSDTAQVGTLFEPDLEALNELGPDLIIVGGRSSTQTEQTSRVARSVDMTIWGDDLIAQARQRIVDYGKLFDRNAQADALLIRLDEAIEYTRLAAQDRGNALIVMTNGPKLSIYGPGSRFGWVHSVLSIPSAVEGVDAGTHGDAISFEFIAKEDPDWLIVVDRAAAIGSGEQNARATLDNEIIHQTTAWKKGQIIYVPSASIYIAAGGAQSTIEVLDRIAEGFLASR
jgi:iron complex transport system substrate-binding protein